MRSSLRQVLTLALIALALAAGVFLLRLEALDATLAAHGPAAAEQAALSAEPEAPPPGFSFAVGDVVEAFRQGSFDRASELLEARAAGDPQAASDAELLIGLYAYASDRPDLAARRLAAAEGSATPLEDWRLFALADLVREQGDYHQARELFTRLTREHGESPLVHRAALEAARIAWEDEGESLEAIRILRSSRGSGAAAEAIDELAWTIARDSGDGRAEREAARLLLIHSPQRARELQVASVFADPNGRIESWNGVLTPEEIKTRAANWLDRGMGSSAKATLATLAESRRDDEWHLLQARALLLMDRPTEARRLLDRLDGDAPAERAAIEWHRAQTAAELAVAERGNQRSSQKRERYARQAEKHLRNVLALNADADLSLKAARRLFPDLMADDRFDEAMQMLRLIKRLDRDDDTGAAYLWEQGWEEFRQGNHTGAVGYWTELEDLYPADFDGHRGRYWKARALEAMGEKRRAREDFAQVVAEADTIDFYVRQAQLRLGEDSSLAVRAERTSQAWPTDPALRRVDLLVDLGLDPLAKIELGLLDGQVDRAEVTALQGIMMVRSGKPRAGIVLLRKAYPHLGSAYQGRVPEEVLRAYYPLRHGDVITEYAEKANVPAPLVAGIIRQESAFDVRATSRVGARGLMQLMPATAREWAGKLDEPYSPERLYRPEVSVKLGSHYFRWVLDRFDGNVELALAGYNGGPNRIKRLWNEEGPEAELDLFVENLKISESQTYLRRIVLLADSYRQLYPDQVGDAAGKS